MILMWCPMWVALCGPEWNPTVTYILIWSFRLLQGNSIIGVCRSLGQHETWTHQPPWTEYTSPPNYLGKSIWLYQFYLVATVLTEKAEHRQIILFFWIWHCVLTSGQCPRRNWCLRLEASTDGAGINHSSLKCKPQMCCAGKTRCCAGKTRCCASKTA